MGQSCVAPAIGAKMASRGVAECDGSLLIAMMERENTHERVAGGRDGLLPLLDIPSASKRCGWAMGWAAMVRSDRSVPHFH